MDNILESILDYVNSDYTDYALMISGDTGSGKTYFWSNTIKPKIESLETKKYKTIYISLCGIASIEEISKKIFIETTQLMDKSLKKYMNSHKQNIIPEYAKIGLDMANFFGIVPNEEKMEYEELFSIDDKVLCFDDLERANINASEILGYINNLVEHDHMKTIIICNEKELITKTTNDYEKIKEKLIGETFLYVPECSKFIDKLIARFKPDKSLIKFLKANKKLIISTFERSGTNNVRMLKQALNDFKKIYDIVDETYPNRNELIVQAMLIFTIAVSFEIKSDKTTKEIFKNIQNNDEYKNWCNQKCLDNKQNFIDEFDSNYYYNFKSDYRFFKFIEKYVSTRILDMNLLKKDIEEAEAVTTGERNIPAYKRILMEEYWKIPDNKFEETLNEILETVKSGTMELIEIAKLYIYFIYFIKNKLANYDLKELKEIFISGMKLSAKHSNYFANAKEELEKISIYNYSEDVKEVIDEFYKLNEQVLINEYKKEAQEIFKLIPMKMTQFYEKFDKKFMDVPIFKYVAPYQVFQRISCASNEDIVTIKEKILKRAKLYPEVAKQEKENMKQIKELIDEYLENKETSIKIVILKNFSNDLNEIIKKA